MQELQVDEKIKYSKWKAAEIAKAFREGRIPQPGPAKTGAGNEYAIGERPASPHSDLEEMSITSSSGAPNPPSPPKPVSSDLNTPVSPTTPVPRTPMRSPGFSDGTWSTAATPGIEISPNVFGGAPNGQTLTPSALKHFNAALAASNSSPKPKSSLSTSVYTADSQHIGIHDSGGDTDEEDGQWSTVGNNAFSRQGSMVPPPPDFNRPPPVVVTPSLGTVHEEGLLEFSVSTKINLFP